MTFTLPRIDPAIPLRLVPRSAKRRGAHLSRALLQAGIINDDTLPRRLSADHVETSRAALTAWLNQNLSGLECLRPSFALTLGSSEGGEALQADRPELHATITWYGGGSGTWDLGSALDWLEGTSPGLGRTVLRVLERQSHRTLPLVTPNEILYFASVCYWCGEDDEAMVLEESCGEDEQELEAMRASMIKRKDFDGAYPEWALKYPKKGAELSLRALRSLRRASNSQRVKAILDDVIALSAISLPMPNHTELDGYPVGFGGVMVWGKDDHFTRRVLDDFDQMVGESGDYFEECGVRELDVSGPDGFIAWQEEMKPWFAAVRLLDALIGKLLEGDWSRLPRGST